MKKLHLTLIFACIIALADAQTPNSWRRVADVGGTVREGGVGFSIDSFGYVGLGLLPDSIGGFIYLADFWQYNPSANSWTQKANFPGDGRAGAISFVIGSKAYVGLGENGNNAGYGLKDFWEYDPSSDTWTQLADFGGGYRITSAGFSIGAKGYAGFGYSDTAHAMKDFWEYDPISNIWTQKNDFIGFPRINALSFGIGSFGYMGLGYDENFGLNGLYLNDFWQYDPSTDTWLQKSNYPGSGRGGGFTFTIGNVAYLGTGFDSTYNLYSDFWQYDPQGDQWIEKDSFGGGSRNASVAFSIGDKGYAGTGDTFDVAHYSKGFWMYTPDSIATGIKPIDANSIIISPNPATDGLYVGGLSQTATLTISDMTGRVCATPIDSEIDISALPSGVYCLRIQDSGGSVVRKFVKE